MNVLVRASRWLFEIGARPYAWYTDAPNWQESCASLANAFPTTPGQRLLDLGCGPGVGIVAMFNRRPDCQYVGLDRGRAMVTLAKRRCVERGLAAPLLIGDACSLPFSHACFDAVACHSILYLLPHPSDALREIARVLRPGGTLALMEPARGYTSPTRLLRFSKEPRFLASVLLWRVMSRAHVRYDQQRLERILSGAGFNTMRVQCVLGGVGVQAMAVRSAS